MRTRIIPKMLNDEVEEYLTRNDIVIVPVGTVEMHGGFPLDSETVVSEAFALKMAEACDGLVLTGLPYFYAGATASGRGTVIDNSDIKYLMKFPKIGKKTAQQMVLDLAGKFAELPAETTNTTANQTAGNQQLDEAMEALLALGYKATELKKVKAFFEDTNETAEQYIKSALKMLMK